ncbi:MAG: porphobilinogen synthase [Alphaproteobacteria bacterium]|nr:porphobilinogen synthase [Alphaproteobacteria bacterium]
MFPNIRLRRTRQTAWLRNLVAENAVSVNDLIWTGFVVEGQRVREPIPSMPDVARLSIDELVAEAQELKNLGINAMAIFPALDSSLKNAKGSEATNQDGLICRAVTAVKKAVPDMGIICDVALDPFTDHAHDGLLVDGKILNDETVAVLCEQAIVQARAGCDIIAPSDMMDGRVGAIRTALDKAGFQNTLILSYAAKYASGFYGPFRDALNNRGSLKGDKKTYQMDPANSDEALREVAMDIDEGADMVMVKPGMPYLDIVARVKTTFNVPTFVYQVSGEYAMWKAASANGWIDGERILMESMLCFKRAGADAILTYAAKDVAKLLRK